MPLYQFVLLEAIYSPDFCCTTRNLICWSANQNLSVLKHDNGILKSDRVTARSSSQKDVHFLRGAVSQTGSHLSKMAARATAHWTLVSPDLVFGDVIWRHLADQNGWLTVSSPSTASSTSLPIISTSIFSRFLLALKMTFSVRIEDPGGRGRTTYYTPVPGTVPGTGTWYPGVAADATGR